MTFTLYKLDFWHVPKRQNFEMTSFWHFELVSNSINVHALQRSDQRFSFAMHYSQYISGNLEPDSVELGLLFQVAGSKVEKLGGRLANKSSSSAHSRARIYFMLQSLLHPKARLRSVNARFLIRRTRLMYTMGLKPFVKQWHSVCVLSFS